MVSLMVTCGSVHELADAGWSGCQWVSVEGWEESWLCKPLRCVMIMELFDTG